MYRISLTKLVVRLQSVEVAWAVGMALPLAACKMPQPTLHPITHVRATVAVAFQYIYLPVYTVLVLIVYEIVQLRAVAGLIRLNL